MSLESIPHGYRKCSKCGEVKPHTKQHFSHCGRCTNQLGGVCRICLNKAEKIRRPNRPKKPPLPYDYTPTTEQIELFWSKVDKSEGDNACWIWKGTLFKGYGRIAFYGRNFSAHRMAWQLTNGFIPRGLFACHHCDNPPCVNPSHLFLGTNKENMQDMKRKGRGHNFKGENNSNSKLTQQKADEIRERYALGGITKSQLAKEYGVTPRNIRWIIARVRWNY